MKLIVSPYNFSRSESPDHAWAALRQKMLELRDLEINCTTETQARLNQLAHSLIEAIEQLSRDMEEGRKPREVANAEIEALEWQLENLDEQYEEEDLRIHNQFILPVRELNSASLSQNVWSAKQAWSRLHDVINRSEWGNLIPEQLLEEIDRLIAVVDDISPPLIYKDVHGSTLQDVPQLIVEWNQQLADYIVSDPKILHNLSPRAFEELIADIFSSFGYRVELTAQTRDGGKDIIAIRTDNSIATKLLIECKRYSPARKIGVALIRELYAVKTLERATKAIMATTTTYSLEARALEAQHRYELELKDFSAIAEWAKSYSQWLKSLRCS